MHRRPTLIGAFFEKIEAYMEPWFSVKPERTVSSWDHFIRGIVNKLLNVCPDQPQ